MGVNPEDGMAFKVKIGSNPAQVAAITLSGVFRNKTLVANANW